MTKLETSTSFHKNLLNEIFRHRMQKREGIVRLSIQQIIWQNTKKVKALESEISAVYEYQNRNIIQLCTTTIKVDSFGTVCYLFHDCSRTLQDSFMECYSTKYFSEQYCGCIQIFFLIVYKYNYYVTISKKTAGDVVQNSRIMIFSVSSSFIAFFLLAF